ncbi:hypothetical protein ABZY00_07425 [Streptomyces griseoflavus]
MPRTSGAPAARARSVLPPSVEARVRPPPARATAVATRARRWVFFQRASCRRRAARPVPEAADVSGGRSAAPKAGASAGVSSGAGPGGAAPAGREVTVAVEGRAVAAAVACWPPSARGAMSGA